MVYSRYSKVRAQRLSGNHPLKQTRAKGGTIPVLIDFWNVLNHLIEIEIWLKKLHGGIVITRDIDYNSSWTANPVEWHVSREVYISYEHVSRRNLVLTFIRIEPRQGVQQRLLQHS